MVNCMLSGEDLWDAVNEWVDEVMNKKEKEEQQRKNGEVN